MFKVDLTVFRILKNFYLHFRFLACLIGIFVSLIQMNLDVPPHTRIWEQHSPLLKNVPMPHIMTASAGQIT